MDWQPIVLPALAAGIAGFALGRSRTKAPVPVRPPRPAPISPPREAPAPPSGDQKRMQLLQRAAPLHEAFGVMAHPDDLQAFPAFAACVAMLADPAFTLDDLFGYLVGDNPGLACAAAEALGHRADFEGHEAELVPRLRGISNFARRFLLRWLARAEDPALPVQVLLQLDPSWSTAMAVDLLRDYLRGRLHDEAIAQKRDALRALAPEHAGLLRTVLAPLDDSGAVAILAIQGGAGAEEVDLAQLRTLGRVLEPDARRREPLPLPTQDMALRELREALAAEPIRSLLLVGEPGVGKRTVIGRLAEELLAEGWVVFEAGATQLLAGQTFMGQLEQRLQDLRSAAGGRRRALWLVPDLPELVFAGRHLHSRTSILDQLLPDLLSGHLRILAPLSPAALEQVLRSAPALRTAAVAVRLAPAGSEETLALARQWLDARQGDGARWCDGELLAELFQRSQQYLGELARPGSLLQLLSLLAERVRQPGQPPRAATLDDAIALLSRLTGLPPAILDDREGLDLDGLRRAFTARVLGQPEAVDCLVERVAMIKAGLCDPQRPLGVFLFTGPTGTGKTELARALAEYLFGKTERMLRLDMSEFQHPESVGRLLGDADEVHGRRALVHRIREQPFALVLLDEIEKAHPMVFDLFLQVFDEGRLTDRRGLTADFRHAIFVLTSNVGVRSLEGSALGFGERGPDLQRALEEVFRREFLNRIDRVVVFRSLDRDTLRQVLHKELDAVLQRRGLRQRQWAIEWDESALALLLEQGYTPALGARPLRRAIERLVLAPLAAAIVTDRTPAGDQFLFVRSDGHRIHVEFVDPDAGATETPAPPASTDLRTLAREGQARAADAAALQGRIAAMQAKVAGESWKVHKAAAFAAMGEADFWSSPRRHAVLSKAELMDRIEVALRKAGQRAAELTGRGDRLAAEPLRQVATRALLLELAIAALEDGGAQDAWLQVQPVHDPHGEPGAAKAFAGEVWAMYRSWAERRGMEWRVLREDDGGALAAVAGFGAGAILLAEAGLHVLEPEQQRARVVRVRVMAAAQPSEPAGADGELAMAQAALLAASTTAPAVVRRYRRGPSPEVRDRRRGWRTGKWDRVMAGDFDLFA